MLRRPQIENKAHILTLDNLVFCWQRQLLAKSYLTVFPWFLSSFSPCLLSSPRRLSRDRPDIILLQQSSPRTWNAKHLRSSEVLNYNNKLAWTNLRSLLTPFPCWCGKLYLCLGSVTVSRWPFTNSYKHFIFDLGNLLVHRYGALCVISTNISVVVFA